MECNFDFSTAVSSMSSDRFWELAYALRDLSSVAPGSVAERAGEIESTLRDLSLSDDELRLQIRLGKFTAASARGTLETGLTTMREIVRTHGMPGGADGSREVSLLLRYVIETWGNLNYRVNQSATNTRLPEFDALPQARRVEIMSSPLSFMRWLLHSSTDWLAFMSPSDS